MRFVIINPKHRTADLIEAKDPKGACTMARIDSAKTDHGVVARTSRRGIAIIVFQYGLFVPVHRQKYFAVGRQLYAGNGVLYAFNHVGQTIDFEPPIPLLRFFTEPLEIEEAIHRHQINRPELKLNGEVIWSWPSEAPPEFREAVDRAVNEMRA